MKILNVKQGSPEWIAARIGRPTSSCFDQIMQPKKRQPSASQSKYLAKLVAEWMLGMSLDDAATDFMQRGSELEVEAVNRYMWEQDVTTEEVGFVLRDDEKVGSSPDRLVGTNAVAEIKVPALITHVGYMLDPTLLVDAYFTQVQGELWVCEREWAHLVSHHPTLPQVVVRVERDAEFIEALAKCVDGFVAELDAAKDRLAPERERAMAARMDEVPAELA